LAFSLSHLSGEIAKASTSEWRLAGSFFKHKDHNIFWREGGNPSGPVLLLIHGFPTASWDWEKIWPDLARRYRLIFSKN